MISRCYDSKTPAYKGYGKRGIKVCDRWRNSFEAFWEDMGERPAGVYDNGRSRYSIGRINNDKDYCPENCEWQTMKQQQNNRSVNRWIEYGNYRATLTQWAEVLGIFPESLSHKLKKKDMNQIVIEFNPVIPNQYAIQ